jgi:hypothetical protein
VPPDCNPAHVSLMDKQLHLLKKLFRINLDCLIVRLDCHANPP